METNEKTVIVKYDGKEVKVSVIKETRKAFLVSAPIIDIWIPKSKINNGVIKGNVFDYFYHKQREAYEKAVDISLNYDY